MRVLALSIVLIAGSAVATSSCSEHPAGSGCIYFAAGPLVANHYHHPCEDTYADQTTGYLSNFTTTTSTTTSTTTTTLAPPPLATDPAPVDEPTGSVAPTSSSPSTTTTTTSIASTTTSAPGGGSAPVALTASGACSPTALGIAFSGTGAPGAQITIATSDPVAWYAAQPSPATVVATDGSWHFQIVDVPSSWFPATVHLAQSAGGTALVSVGSC